MARPKSDDKRNAILSAAIQAIVNHGLSASTALIAQEAGVANGTFFTYFKTKSELFNQLYLELKTGMASTALDDMPPEVTIKEQIYNVWSNWVHWAVESPNKRRALALLGVSDELTAETRDEGHLVMAPLARLIEQIHENGAMRDAGMEFVIALMNSIAETTMDFARRSPEKAEEYCKTGFDALWRLMA